MQGLAGFWQREQRALKSQRPVADSSVIQRYWPDAPVPQLKELRTPQPPPKREGRPPAPDGQGPEPQLPEGEEISDGEAKRMLEEFRQSETCQQIRDTIRSDPQELESFLEELTKSNPELIKAIAKHQTDFLRILTTGFTIKAKAEPDELVEEAEVLPPPPPAVVASQRKARREAKAARQARNAMQPLSSTCHTLASAHSPYSCAVCKSLENLSLCSACQCVRFCSKEHQRAFWPRHQSVCKFLASIKGGLLQQAAGRRWMQDFLPELMGVWTRTRGTAPQPWELEQLVHIPHCGNCGKAPATVVCKICHFYGYCSEACLEAQKSHRNSWQCFQVGATAVVMSFLQKAGSAYPFLTMQETGEVPESVYRSGWQEFVAYSKLVGRDGKEFQTMPPAAQQTVIDALSFPLSVLEACWVANHSFVRKHIKVHILNPFGSTLADLVKYEEWFHRCPDVITLELHFIGTEVIVPAAAVDSCLELALCESCSSKSRKMTCHFHTCPLLEFIEEEIAAGSPPPFLRVAYSTAFGRLPAEAAVPWTAALTRLAERPDAAPLVVTERVFCDAGQDEEMLRNCGWRTVVPPRCCRFPSPLVSRDDIRDCEDNPIGLSIWNMSWAVFKAGAVPTDEEEEPPKDVGSEQTKVKSASQSEVEVAAEIFIAHKALESPDACSIGERVLNERMQWGTVTGKRCCGFPDSVEVVLDSGVRKHFLPDELLPVPSDVVAKPAPLPQLPLLEDPSCYRLLVQHPGPWRYDGKTKEDVAFNPEANPDSFVVSVSACCEGGRGFRSPLTSRNDKPSSGYVFYADGEDQWEFWVGDGDYWCGVQGPPVEQKWTELVGLYDAELRSVAFFVDGTCAGVRSGVDFRPNTLCPLRIGAGRSENEFARYYWTGSVRDIKIYQILPKSDS